MAGKGLFWLLIALIVLGAAVTVWASSESPSAKPQERNQRWEDRRALEACRHIQNDKIQELATRRVARAACDKMEAAYKRRWGLTY